MATPQTLDETALFKHLLTLSNEPDILQTERSQRQKAIALVQTAAEDARQLMKRTVFTFPQYTLHDSDHLVRVVHIMSILQENCGNGIHSLNYIETTLLILSAYLHDIGMVPDQIEINTIISSPEFLNFRLSHKDELEQINQLRHYLADPFLSQDKIAIGNRQVADIEGFILSNYLRIQHVFKGEEKIRQMGAENATWEIDSINLSGYVADLCLAHGLNSDHLFSERNGRYAYDRHIGTCTVNMMHCAILLRLSDILDFDRERVPAILFKNISPTSQISLLEWNKHASVLGWTIAPDHIIFECECTHPIYEKAVREFFNSIDSELQLASYITRDLPQRNGIASRYKLTLPLMVERTRVRPSNQAYIYTDLTYTLSHREIMLLLMDKSLWGGSSLVVRELVQNAYDAIRMRRAICKSQGVDWESGKITLTLRRTKDKRLQFICRDNGTGMNVDILQKYYFNVGRSFYRSADFEEIKIRLKSANADFDPISQFGIGAISSFMFGDQIEITTRRFISPLEGSELPLEVEVSGIAELAVLRKSNNLDFEPGTEIKITGPFLPDLELDDPRSADPLGIVGAANFYIQALDVPVEILVESPLPRYQQVIKVPTRPLRVDCHFNGDSNELLSKFEIFEIDLEGVCANCEGTARIPMLRDDQGRVSTCSAELQWEHSEESTHVRKKIRDKTGNIKGKETSLSETVIIAQDGILVSSTGLRSEVARFVGTRYSAPRLGMPVGCFINLRGNGKLPLKPNRAPYNDGLWSSDSNVQKWQDFTYSLICKIGTVLFEVCRDQNSRPNPDEFWRLVFYYDFNLKGWLALDAKNLIPIPVNLVSNLEFEWLTIAEMENRGITFISLNIFSGQRDSTAFIAESAFDNITASNSLRYIEIILLACTEVCFESGYIVYRILNRSPFSSLKEVRHYDSPWHNRSYQAYSNELKRFLAVHNPLASANCDHPCIKACMNQHATDSERPSRFFYGVNSAASLARCPEIATKDYGQFSEDTKDILHSACKNMKRVNWQDIPEELHLPYYIYFPQENIEFKIDRAFLQWANSELDKERSSKSQSDFI